MQINYDSGKIIVRENNAYLICNQTGAISFQNMTQRQAYDMLLDAYTEAQEETKEILGKGLENIIGA